MNISIFHCAQKRVAAHNQKVMEFVNSSRARETDTGRLIIGRNASFPSVPHFNFSRRNRSGVYVSVCLVPSLGVLPRVFVQTSSCRLKGAGTCLDPF